MERVMKRRQHALLMALRLPRIEGPLELHPVDVAIVGHGLILENPKLFKFRAHLVGI